MKTLDFVFSILHGNVWDGTKLRGCDERGKYTVQSGIEEVTSLGQASEDVKRRYLEVQAIGNR